jgi:hypothetical protein
MTNIIDINEKLQKKKDDNTEEKYIDSHSFVLDSCEEVFPYGAIVIEITEDKSVNISATGDLSADTMIDALVSAAFKLKSESEK